MNSSLATRPSGSASTGPDYEPDGGRTAMNSPVSAFMTKIGRFEL